MSTSSSSSSFKDKVAQLERETQESSRKMSSKESCFPTLMIVGIAAPFLLLILLFFLQPSFVQRQENDGAGNVKYVRDGRKVFYWSLALTLLLWLGLYLYTYCSGYSAVSMLCSK